MPDKRQLLRDAFLKAVFSLLGYVAACDKPLNREEIKRLKIHIKKMQLSADEQQQALALFKAASQPNFNASEIIQAFRQTTTPKLMQILIVHLITMARADGGLVEKELHAIQWLARELGYKSIVLMQLLKMIYSLDQQALRKTQLVDAAIQNEAKANSTSANQFSNQSAYQATGNSSSNYQNPGLANAYKTLGVNAGMTEDEIRRAYKKLASQFHPDKLAGQGLAQEELNKAAEEFKKILAAYKYLKQHRFMYGTAAS